MTRDRAAYMRDYRARQRAIDAGADGRSMTGAYARIGELEEEVAHLKRLLAEDDARFRSHGRPVNPYRAFTPVPKPGQKGK